MSRTDQRIGGIIAADLDGDRFKDFIITKPGHIECYNNIGNKLWVKKINIQLTSKAESNGLPGLHAPGVQAADVDGDGETEVLFLTKDKNLQIYNGKNGSAKLKVKIPSPEGTDRWEHIVVSNFRGKGDRDILLQATNTKGYRMGRYIAAYAMEELLKYREKVTPLWIRDEFISCYEMDHVAPGDWTEKGVEVITTIDWMGGLKQLAAAKERHKSGDVCIFDPLSGKFICRFEEKADRLYVADVFGDWREELIVLSGNELHIYQNPEKNPNPNQQRLWKKNHYRRSKMTWNYYNP